LKRAKIIGELVRDWADAIEKAKYLSSDESFASAWLLSILKDTPSTMSNSEFRAALKFRLGFQFTTLLSRCCCPCQTKICNLSRHLFSCNEFKNFSPMQHDAVQYDLKQLGTHEGIHVIDAGLGQMIERDIRKADLVFKSMGRSGQDLADETSIRDSSAQSYRHNSAHISKYVLTLLKTNKLTKYAADYL
jgi:hypothetical protein